MNIPVSTFDRIRKYKLAGLKINPSIANISSLNGVKLKSDDEKKKQKKKVEHIVCERCLNIWPRKRKDIELSRFLSWPFVVKFYVHTPIH